MAALAVEKYLETLNTKKKIFMVLGMMANKEHKEFILTFKDKVHSVIALDIPNQINFIEKEKLSKIAQSCGIPSKTENSIEESLKNIAKENESAIILCVGSLYFAADASIWSRPLFNVRFLAVSATHFFATPFPLHPRKQRFLHISRSVFVLVWLRINQERFNRPARQKLQK